MPGLRRLSLRRVVAGAAACTWLAVGLIAAFHYVHSYAVYRGFPVPKTPKGIPTGGLKNVSFYSPAIGRTSHYLIYLPPGYKRGVEHGKRYPVFYLLHGYPGKAPVFIDAGAINVADDVLSHEHKIPPTILVMPTGKNGILGADTEWANTPSGRWEDYVIDVVHNVDSRFATYPDRQHRGITGDSEGAYSAVNIALHHLDLFSVVESWGGYFSEVPASGVFAHAGPAVVRANSPMLYVSSLAPKIRKLGLRAWLYQGRFDSQNPGHLVTFGQKLNKAGASVHIGFYPGGHDWGVWRQQTPHMLLVAGRWFEQRPRGRASFASTGKSLTVAQLRAINARKRAKCLALPSSAHFTKKCRRYRAAAGL
jgi:enterochelin esterase-like enzyme